MRTKIKNINFFYIAWVLMVIHICVANSSYQNYANQYVSYCSFIFVCLKIFMTKYTLKEVLISLAIILMGGISTLFTSDMLTVWFSLFTVASKNTDFNRIVKITLRTMIICCISFILLSFLGFSDIYRISVNKGVMYSFGLGHPNMVSAYYGIIVILYIYLNYDKINYKKLLLLSIFEVIVYCLTKCLTGICVFAAVMLVILLLKNNKNINFKKLIFYALIGLIIFFSITPIIYNDFLYTINDVLTGRLSQANFYYQKYGIDLFGNNVFKDLTSITTDNILDNGYARMLILNGLWYYSIIVFSYIYNLKKSIKLDKCNVIVLLTFYVVYTCIENVGTYIFMNVTLLLFAKILFKEEYNEDTKSD